jgi:hypothetical protein
MIFTTPFTIAFGGLVVCYLIVLGFRRLARKRQEHYLEGKVQSPPPRVQDKHDKSDLPWIMKRLGGKTEDLDEDS